jgi:hypothetical protein
LALFDFLASTEHNRRILNTLLNNLQTGTGRDAESLAQLDRLYPGGVARLETDLKRYLARGRQKA